MITIFWLFRLIKRQPKALQNQATLSITSCCGIASSRAINRLTTIHEEEWIITQKEKAIIYMNPNVEDKYISEIIAAFWITSEPVIRYDYSEHYKCYFDR